MYSDFALVYDRLMADVDYAGWADFYCKLLDRAGVAPGAKIAECACGTGGLTLPLSQHYQITGVDSSQEMLSIAADKLRSAGRQVSLVRQDMRRLRLHSPQDAVLCTCDGLNYLSSPQGARRFFEAANRALKPGGALVFDISSLYKLRHVLGNRTLFKADGDIRYIWQNHWQERHRLLDLRLQIFVSEPDGRYRLIEEAQRQRGYELDALRDALSAVGFGGIRFFGDRHFDTIREDEQRIHALCIKEEEIWTD